MQIALVNPPRSNHDLAELGPPLGLLNLTRAAGDVGIEAGIVDFNLLWHTTPDLQIHFYERATELLLSTNARIYGFTSMAVDSHVSLELARRVKEANPRARTVLGGTHFSALAERIPHEYPWVDRVIPREGEGGLVDFAFACGVQPRAGSPKASTYSGVDLEQYFSVNPRRMVDVESARGCRFKCSFCYSPGHYPQRTSLDISRLIADLHELRDGGAKHFFLVDDNFLNEEERAIEVCAALEAASMDLTWHCYATLPQLSPRAVVAMAHAGCVAVFTGIDAVGKDSQRTYGKRFANSSEDSGRKIRLCLDHGIVPTCAFLVAPPSHPCGADSEQTVKAALSARVLGANIRLNILTQYPGTRLASDSGQPVEFDDYRVRVGLDAPAVIASNDYAAVLPELFPFHSRYVPSKEWRDFVQQVHCLFTLLYARTDELADRLQQDRPTKLFPIATQVLEEIGDLLRIDTLGRRQAEVIAFDSINILDQIAV